MSNLHIPRESIEALYTAADRIEFDQYDESSVDAIARPVVAAELRRMVEDVGPHWGVAAMVLRDRTRGHADELEAGR